MEGTWVWVPVLGIVAPMVMIVLVVWAIARSKQKQAQYRADVQAKMIEKFSSAPEFTEFLSTPAGRQFAENLQAAPACSAHDRIFAGIKWSLMLAVVGIALLVARAMGEDSGLIMPGAILLGLGVALLVSTVISYRLSKQWGLIKSADSASLPGVNS